ncbi:ABC transporter ATP-binding protein [Enterocloster citroniae]|uniref:ABC transporter ATP-binding protein n=1 Tax=Enterocloster citroniae TaxID=358743 RepID=UPI001D06E53F|nr:ABC transporter ATP-binding protein [Enterocloster citroniae]MCB7068100.1 ABC transporter ATP-binding protein [Enterocloster citroniae]
MKEIIISGKGICKTFSGKGVKNQVLNHIDADIYKGDFTVIMGASGAGKSTLLYCLSGMDRITDGRVFYRGEEISSYHERRMAKLRSEEFGFVFQQSHLISNLTLFENVAVAGYISGRTKAGGVRRKADELLRQMKIEKAGSRLPGEVSGGEAQRAAIARAMIHEPVIMFADEPTGALNRRNTEEVLDLLTALNLEGQSIILVTHDLRAAVRGNRIIYLEDGKNVGELTLTPFTKSASRERESRLNAWLADLEW